MVGIRYSRTANITDRMIFGKPSATFAITLPRFGQD